MVETLFLLVMLGSTPTEPGPFTALGPVPADSVRLFLVRHAQAVSNLDPRPRLSPAELDHLTPLGRSQAAQTATLLRAQRVRTVLTSPAGRARETAEVLARALRAGATAVEARVRPLELGRSAEGKPLGWDERMAEWKAGRDPRPSGGESLRQLADRVLDLTRSLAAERAGQGVVVVSHGEVVAALVGALRGGPAHEWEELSLKNASVTVVEASAGKPPRLLLVNVLPVGEARP